MSENYLKNFSRLLEGTEVPERFTLWAGIASLLATLERRVFINQGVFTIYPNFYIILVAASGQKKSTAVNTAARLLKRLNPKPNIVSQKITPEALIGALKVMENTLNTRVMEEKSGGIVIADELTTFIDKNTIERGLGAMLTELFDCKDYEYQTKTRGVELLKDPYFSILGGTTTDSIRDALPRSLLVGGFTSRTIFIYDESISAPVAWIDYDEELVELEQRMVNYLQRLMELTGPITVSPEAKKFYIQDYNDRHSAGSFRTDPLLRSYENRRATHLFRVAIALMVSEAPQLTLELQHIRSAKVILEEAEELMPRVVKLISASETGTAGSQVMDYIDGRCNGKIDYVTRRDLVRNFANQFDSQEITKFIETLVKAERIKIDTIDGSLVYRKIGART